MEKLSDHKTLSKTEKDMLLLKEIDIQYNIKNGGYLIDQLIKWGRKIFTDDISQNWRFNWY